MGCTPLVWTGLCLALSLLLSAALPQTTQAGVLQPRLARLVDPGRSPLVGPPELAQTTPEGLWRVQVLVSSDVAREPGRGALVRDLGALGAEVRGQPWLTEPRVWEVDAPFARLSEIARLAGVLHVGQLLGPMVPPRGPEGAAPRWLGSDPQGGHGAAPGASPAFHPTPASSSALTESEALAEMRVPDAHALGYRGAGVRIGIVDIGFDGYLERVGGELPVAVQYRDFTDSGPSNQSHGTACAEVIADIAPEAELYLAEIGSSLELQRALDWMIEQQVEVISHSLAWFLGGGDGTGPIAEMTRSAADEGIHWVTSSGNFRRSFWRGEARNEDGDPYIDTGSGNAVRISNTTNTSTIDLVLAWDRWPLSESVSFQIDIYDGDTLIGSSATDFGADYPFAYREVAVPSAGRTSPEFRIRNDRGDPTGVRLRVFRVDGGSLSEEDRIEFGSLAVPADSPWVLSVGAYSYRATVPEQFSSYGPTEVGLTKPDLIAADGISTSLPRYSRFVGTSAACPHVSGAVALLLSARLEGGAYDLHWSRGEVATLLRASAEPFLAVAEAEQGWGRVRVPLRPVEAAASPLRLAASGPAGILLHLRGVDLASAGPIDIYDVTGRRVASLRPMAPGASSLAPFEAVATGGTEPGARGTGTPGGTTARSGTVGSTISGGTGDAIGTPGGTGNRGAPGGVDYELRRGSLPLLTGRYWAREAGSGASLPFLWVR